MVQEGIIPAYATSRWVHNARTYKMISHEVPMDLIEYSRWFNDYDYALVHLFETHPDYFEFYEKSLRWGRMVILDNSLYELGNAFDPNEYLEWILRLRPTYYIVPDAFWDAGKTIGMAMEWMTNQGRQVPPECKPIGVAQGATYRDVVRSYKFFESVGAEYIAFTFKFHEDMYESLHMNEYLWSDDGIVVESSDGRRVSGLDLIAEDKASVMRYVLLKKLQADKVINASIKHHLLGLQNTTFLDRICNAFPWVSSIDTSNPVVYALEGKRYNKTAEFYNKTSSITNDDFMGGLSYIGNGGIEKPAVTINDIFEEPVDASYIPVLRHNINAFREIVNPQEMI